LQVSSQQKPGEMAEMENEVAAQPEECDASKHAAGRMNRQYNTRDVEVRGQMGRQRLP